MVARTVGNWALSIVALLLLTPTAAKADDGVAEATLSEESQALAISRGLVREAADYSFRRWLRNRVWDDEDESRYGLEFDENWQSLAATSPKRPLVILVHGYNSSPARNAAILEPIRAAEYPCAMFAYPNDWEIWESAQRLSEALKEVAQRHPDQQVALVTHSMGGLVARACLEDREFDPGNVGRLVMIAPPTHGTMLAHIAVATDIWEHWLGRADGGPWLRCRDSIIDGLGEAADDMVPGSAFLAELNSRPRNSEVRYTIFLGTCATISEGEMKWMRRALQKTGDNCPGLSDCAGHVNNLLSDMEELVEGKGDGVVALKRGRLDGVDDVVILPFGHLNCTGPADCEVVEQVQAELMARLK
jgi:pimeloyl-ACP methyl ester carboxylesterase